uniref:Uncharacterized protein n=1 Tax=Anguilla anguilla TaxID=7936 RepID=A0A0E9QIG2_ANGAN
MLPRKADNKNRLELESYLKNEYRFLQVGRPEKQERPIYAKRP